MSSRTSDLMKGMRFYTNEQLGPNRHKTPEGFLICMGVPIARIGEMVYGPDETPIPPGPDGRVRILRRDVEVFKSDSLASMNGKPVTDDHPPVDVDPGNWRFFTKGVVVDPRRGEGDQKDLAVADLIIFDKDLIEDIEAGKREVSCGYNPEYLPILDAAGNEQPGRGEQVNILYNHLALVKFGRCGPRCSIGDHRTVDNKGENDMSSWKDRLRQAFGAKDAAALDTAIAEAEREMGSGGQPHIEVHNHMTQDEDPDKMKEKEKEKTNDAEAPAWFKDFARATDARFKAIADRLDAAEEEEEKEKAKDAEKEEEEKTKDKSKDEQILGQLEFEAPPGTGDAARKARDSAYLAESFQDTLAKAEILAPGIRLPTFDRAAPPAKTFNTICGLRRTALDLAYAAPATRGIIDAALGSRALDTKTMSCSDVRTLFNATAAFQKDVNNKTNDVRTDYAAAVGGGLPVKGSVKTIADINKRNAERFRQKSA